MRIAWAFGILAAGCAAAPPAPEAAVEPRFDGKPLSFYARELHDLDRNTNQSVGRVIAAFGEAGLPHLAEGLRSDRDFIRERAAWGLYELALESPEMEGLVPLLLRCAEDPDPDVRHWGVGALGEMRPTPPGAVEALERRREDPEEKIRKSAGESLERIRGARPE